jgi:hypothetical protein
MSNTTDVLAATEAIAAGTDLETLIARLDRRARTELVRGALERRWTLWMRLTWAVPVSEYTATRDIERWATRLRNRIPGAAVLVGLHSDTDRRHAHALVFIPRQGAPPNPSGGWLPRLTTKRHETLWGHGNVWLDRFRPSRFSSSSHPETRGAAPYLSRDVGTVMQFGSPPIYRRRRTR